MTTEKFSVAWLWAVAAVVAVAAILLVAGCSPAPVAAPTAYVEYNHKSGAFACEYPQGWEADGGGAHGQVWATFESGPAEIRLRGNAIGSLMGDAMGGRHQSDLPPELQPVHKIHELNAKGIENELPGYKEIGQPQELEVALGPARVSEFTATTTFGSGLHGYRVTVLGHNKGVTAFCICPESDWKTLQPAFDHTLGTLKRGTEEM
jgi:hypothetical protein